MFIGELSQQVNLSRDTIRFYEKMELIRPHVRDNGYKEYSEQNVQQLQLIQVAKNLGFTLTEIKQILNLIDIEEIPAKQFQQILATKLAVVLEKIQQLQQIKSMLEGLMHGESCPLKKNCDISEIDQLRLHQERT